VTGTYNVGHTIFPDFATSVGGTNPGLRPPPPVGEPRCLSSSLLLTYSRNMRPLVSLPRAKLRAGAYDALSHFSVAPQTHVPGSCRARLAALPRRQTKSLETIQNRDSPCRPGPSGSHRSGNLAFTRKTQNMATFADRKRFILHAALPVLIGVRDKCNLRFQLYHVLEICIVCNAALSPLATILHCEYMIGRLASLSALSQASCRRSRADGELSRTVYKVFELAICVEVLQRNR
jgi:hypothetical protein